MKTFREYSLYTEVFINERDLTLIVELCVASLEAALNTQTGLTINTKTLSPSSCCSCNIQHTSLFTLLEESSLGTFFQDHFDAIQIEPEPFQF
jgi:hypothetical protein